MFLGEYAHNLDDKGRLTIPARLRDELAQGLVITRGYDECLVIYPPSEWSELVRKSSQLPSTSRAARAYSRWVFGGAHETVPDKMGRVLIPSFLREYAGIGEEAIMVGMNTCMEVWDPAKWRRAQERDRGDLDNALVDIAKMGV